MLPNPLSLLGKSTNPRFIIGTVLFKPPRLAVAFRLTADFQMGSAKLFIEECQLAAMGQGKRSNERFKFGLLS